MASKRIFMTFVFIFSCISFLDAQNEIVETIDEARQLYLQKDLVESANCLNRALALMNEELLKQLESIFPEPPNNWRVDPPSSWTTKTAYSSSLVSKCKYYRKGGGQSVDIEIQTNAPRIANIKKAFLNPLMVKQLGDGAKISSVDDHSCIERYDAVDKFAELIFVPTSSVLITIRGYEMKNIQMVAEFAEKMKWDVVSEIFP